MAGEGWLNNKVALVTGGAAGIGLEFAKALLKEGARVAILDLNEARGAGALQELEDYGEVVYIKTDVTKKNEFREGFQEIVQRWNGLDIVINNAGDLNDRNYELEIDLNVKGVVHGSLLAVEFMGKNYGKDGGTVVNTASIAGLEPTSCAPVYSGTKHFVLGFTRSIGTDFFFKQTGIKYLTICPGITATPLIQKVKEQLLPNFKEMPEELDKEFGKFPKQSSECLGPALLKVLKEGSNGSCWVSEGGEEAYEIAFPNRTDLKKS